MLGGHYLYCDYTRRHFLKTAGKSALGLGLLAPGLPCAVSAASTKKIHAYIGTYTRRNRHQGIYALTLDPVTGALSNGDPVAATPSPTYLAVHPTQDLLFAANASVPNREQGLVSAFAIDDKTGSLHFLNSQSSHGNHPCHICIDHTGRWVFTANYNSGTVAVFPIADDGQLGATSCVIQLEGRSADRKKKDPHAHMIQLSGDNRFALVADLGTDKIWSYLFDQEKGTLTPHKMPWTQTAPGAGPRHLLFQPIGPDGPLVFVVNELNSTLSRYLFHVDGTLTEQQTLSTLPDGYGGENYCAAVRASADGRFVYCSNRGHNSIAAFAYNGKSDWVTAIGHTPTGGDHPRDFNIDPTGKFLLVANMNSNNILSFFIDQKTGQLTPTGYETTIPVPTNITFARDQV